MATTNQHLEFMTSPPKSDTLKAPPCAVVELDLAYFVDGYFWLNYNTTSPEMR